MMADAKELLKVENLGVCFIHGTMEAHALRGIDLSFYEKEIHGLVGESGSGKTVTSTCIMGLLPSPPGEITSGRILFENENLLELSQGQMRSYRGRKIAMVFQEPSKYLNPAFKIGEQITEMLRLHLDMNKEKARERAKELLGLVGLGKDGRVLDSYLMSFRGYETACYDCYRNLLQSAFLIADEPTTALDVTLQLQILRLIKELRIFWAWAFFSFP
jgi:ABC-type dipeptide/oligopeptide/nickel transport system ATPase component